MLADAHISSLGYLWSDQRGGKVTINNKITVGIRIKNYVSKGPRKTRSKRQGLYQFRINSTVEPSLTATSPQRPPFWRTVHTQWPLFKLLCNGHFLVSPRWPWGSTVISCKRIIFSVIFECNTAKMTIEEYNFLYDLFFRLEEQTEYRSLALYFENISEVSDKTFLNFETTLTCPYTRIKVILCVYD